MIVQPLIVKPLKKKFANNDVRTYGKSSRFYKGAGETFDFRILVAIIILIILILLVAYSITNRDSDNFVHYGKNNMLITDKLNVPKFCSIKYVSKR